MGYIMSGRKKTKAFRATGGQPGRKVWGEGPSNNESLYIKRVDNHVSSKSKGKGAPRRINQGDLVYHGHVAVNEGSNEQLLARFRGGGK